MISEKLGSFYAGFEDKWYALVDSLEEKGIPIGVYADALDNNGIPSFPFTVALVVIIIAGLFALFFIGLTINPTINLTVTDQFQTTVAGPTVTIYDSGGKQISSPSYGTKIDLKGIWPGAEIRIDVSKSGYESAGTTIKIDKEIIYVPITMKKIIQNEEVLLSVIDELSKTPIPNAVVIVKVPDMATELEAEFLGDNYYHLMGVPTGIELSVSVRADNYEDISNQTRTFSGTGVEAIYMSPKNINLQGTGRLLVTVTDAETNQPVDRAKITIENRDSGAVLFDSFTDNGEFLANDIPKTQPLRVIVQKEDTDYLRYDSLVTNDSIVVIGDEEVLDVMLEHGGQKLTVYTTDTQGQSLTNVKVRLYNSQNELIGEEDSAFSGAVEFGNLNPEDTYYAVAYADGVLPARAEAKISENPEVDLVMDYASTDNASNVSIYVATDLYDVVENATVTFLELKNGVELPIGIPDVQTNLSGYVQVRSPVNIELVAKAVKNSMEGSESVLVRLNELNEIRIFLEDTTALKELYFVGPNNERILGTVVVTAKDGTELYNGTIGDTGYILFDSRGNDVFDVYVVTDTGEEFSEEVNMQGLDYYELVFSGKTVLGLEPRIEFIGVLDEFGAEVEGISPGRYYWLKFETYWPEGDYKGGVHIRIGNDNIQFADSQDVGILGFDAVVGESFYGTSYTPEPAPGNEGIDRQNQGVPGEYNKWLDLYFDNPADTTIVKVKVQARETTSLDDFEVKSRVWGLIGYEYFRNPVDDVLGKDEYNFERTGLYANTKSDFVKILESPDAKCEDGVCVSYFFRDETGLEYESSEFRPALNKNYELLVSILSEEDRNAKLKISTDKSEPKLFVTGYVLDDSVRDNLEVTSLDVSDVRLAQGEEKIVTVNFITTAEGITHLTLQLISGSTIINKEINLEVEGEKELELTVTPEEINVAENFILEIKSQGKKITNATVHLHDSEQNIAVTIIGNNTPKQGENGLYFFENIFAPGEYKFVASADGYASSDLEIEIKAEGGIELDDEIVFNLDALGDVGTVIVDLENKANYKVEQVSFELVNDREFSRNFTLEVDLPDALEAEQKIGVSFTAKYIGENPKANLYSETEVIIRGFISGTYEVLGTTIVKVSYNKKIDSDCLKFDKGALQLYMTGTAGTSKQLELSIENTCDTALELSTRALPRRGDPYIEITANSVSINAGETQNVTIDVLNKVERMNAPPLNFSYSIVFESARIAKGISLNVLIWNPAFSISASDNLVLWLSKSNVEEKAKAMAPIFVRNTGVVPVEDIGFSLMSDDWRLNSISVSIVPAENIPGLMPGQPASPTRSLFAEADIEDSLAEPVPGIVVISGNIDGRRYELRRVNAWIHVSGFECLKAWSDDDLLFQSAESSAGSISKIITVRNQCAEEVNITSISPDKFGQNSIILHPLSATTLRPNQQADFEIILQKRQDYNQENIKVVVKGLLVRTQKFVDATISQPFTIKLGNDIQETSAATSPQEIAVCDSETIKTIYYPLIGTDCSRNYCDAKSLALYLKDKLKELVVEAKSKAYRGSYESANFHGCANNEYCSFTSLGIVPTAFTVFMQNDYMTTQVLQHELSNSGLTEVKNLSVSISDVEISSLATGGWSSQLYVSDDIKGCGMYTFTINGVMQVSNNRILEDNYILLLKSEPERQNTAECANKIQNFMNFLPVDEEYSVTENYNAWPGIIKQKTGLESLTKSFSKELFDVEDRVTLNPSNNKLVLDFGDTQGGILKLEIKQEGSQDSPKTVYAYINRAYETGNTELKEQIAKEAALAVASLTEHSVDGCISEDESSFIIQSYEEFGELSLKAEDELRLTTDEVCIDANVSSEFPEKVTLETDFEKRVTDLGSSEAGVMYVKLKNLDGTEISKDQEIDLVKEEGRELYEHKFQVCAKGSNQFNLAVENMKEIKLTAKSVEVTGRGTRFQPVEEIIKIKVCVIHPYDLFRDMSNAEPGRYYATVGWKGEPNEIDAVDIWRALYRDNQLDRATIQEGANTGLDLTNSPAWQSFIASKKWPALSVYLGACVLTAGLCGWATTLSPAGGLWDAFFDCGIPALIYAGQDSAVAQAIKNFFGGIGDLLWGSNDPSANPVTQTPGGLQNPQTANQTSAEYSNLLVEREIGLGLDLLARAGHVGLTELTPSSATAISDSVAANLKTQLVKEGVESTAADTISKTMKEEMKKALDKIMKDATTTAERRAMTGADKIADTVQKAYTTAMGQTTTKHFNLLSDASNWTSGTIPARFGSAQNDAIRGLFSSTATDDIYSKLSRSSFSATNSWPGATAPTRVDMETLMESTVKSWRTELSSGINTNVKGHVVDSLTSKGISISASDLPPTTLGKSAFAPYIDYVFDPITTTTTHPLTGVTSTTTTGWKVTATVNEGNVKSLVRRGITNFSGNAKFKNKIGKELTDKALAELAEKSKKLNWGQGVKKAVANLWSWQTAKGIGWGVLCGAVSNIAGMGAWNWYWGKNYADPADQANNFNLQGPGNGQDDDDDGKTDEETCDGIDNDGDTRIDEDCGNILQQTIRKYSTYRIDIEQSVGGGTRTINMREITSEADIATMKEDLANGSATRLDDIYCSGQFMEKSIQIVFGSLSPPDSEGARKTVYYSPAIQEPVVNMAIRYKDKGITEAMLMAIVFESVPPLHNLSASQFETQIGVVASELEQLRVSHPSDDEALLRTYAQNHGINAGNLVTTFNRWTGYRIDWENQYGNSSSNTSGNNQTYSTLGTTEVKNLIIAAANKYNVPPEILLAVADKESSMNHFSSGTTVKLGDKVTRNGVVFYRSIGMFQILVEENETKCGMTREQLMDMGNNIECGAQFLKAKYDQWKNGCSGSSLSASQCENCQYGYANYTEWEAALRAYNGWGCSESASHYVPDVMGKAAAYKQELGLVA
ncbi:MAG: transglycosylase SLT domain-containing protein [Candidatus Diapherotrites archaeon]